ncbi:MAG: protein kinase [Firmicutes bacterium]|nr:protein kinase [Bacillota bacterium]
MQYEPMVQIMLRSIQDRPVINNNGTWVIVRWAGMTTPDAGWKFHVSATRETSPIVLAVSIPILAKYRCAFKVAVSSSMLSNLNGRRGAQSQAGKFMTIYPQPEQLEVIAQSLGAALRGLVGPTVPSDRPLEPGSVLSYRYGAFKGHRRINEKGDLETFYRENGKSVLDQRKVYYDVPGHVSSHPLENVSAPSVVQIGLRYKVFSALRQSPKGGVYLARDDNGDVVVIKEGRKWMDGDSRGFDVRTRLALEYITLRHLGDTLYVPKTYNFFLQDGNAYLVQEKIDGEHLGRWLIKAWEREQTEKVRVVMGQVRKTIRDLHERQVVHRDLSPNNIMVTDNSDIVLVDFEFSVHQPSAIPPVVNGTPGYMAPWISTLKPAEPRDDLFTLTRLQLTTAARTFPPSLVLGNRQLRTRPVSGDNVARTKLQDQNLALAHRLVKNLVHTGKELNTSGPGSPWSLHNGLSGTLLAFALLHQHSIVSISMQDATRVVETLKFHLRHIPSKAGGLHFGLAGPALALGIAGVTWQQEDWLALALRLLERGQLRTGSHRDWTHGSAGVLHAAVQLHRHTHDTRLFPIIQKAETDLVTSVVESPRGVFWTSTLSGQPEHYFGFAHGAAGIGFALHEGANLTGNPLARALEQKVLHTLLTHQQQHNWPRSLEDPTQELFWCNGAPGILHALIRLSGGAQDVLQKAAEVAQAMRFANGIPPLGRCHGIVSRTSAYHDLYLATGDSRLRDAAIDTLWYLQWLRQSEEEIGWRDDDGNSDTASLMTGALGIAYAIFQVHLAIPDPILLSETQPALTTQSIVR